MKNDLCIWGGTALTFNAKDEVIPGAEVWIADGKITKICSKKNPKAPTGVKTLDARGSLVLPGFINGHTHAGMTLLRGIADDLPLFEWLEKAIFPMERRWGKPDFVYFGTLLACAEMIKSGTTTFNDMYYFEESAARAVDDAGLRAVLGQTFIEISGVEEEGGLTAKFEEYLKKVSKFKRVIPSVAPHSVYGLSDKRWKEAVAFAEKHDLLLHTHISETVSEVEDCKKKIGISPVKYFEDIGLLERKSVAAHAVVLSEEDIAILGKYRVGISHNPESNLKLGNQICPVVELRAAGCPVMLGTDSTASNNNLDLLQEADIAAKLQVLKYGIGKYPAKEVVRSLTIEGARALHLDSEIGSLEVGKKADVIAVNTQAVHLQPLYNAYSHLVYAANGGDVRHTVVDGKVLMRDRKLLTLDEKSLLKNAMRWGAKIQKSLG